MRFEDVPEIVERFIRLESSVEQERKFWTERIIYISIIVGLITALVLVAVMR